MAIVTYVAIYEMFACEMTSSLTFMMSRGEILLSQSKDHTALFLLYGPNVAMVNLALSIIIYEDICVEVSTNLTITFRISQGHI